MAITDFATIGLGATLEVNDGSGTGSVSGFGVILDIRDMDVPGVEVGNVERKTLNLSDRTLRYKAALKSPGEFSFVCEYSEGKFARTTALIGSDRQFRFTMPDAGDSTDYTVTVPGFIKSCKIDRVAPDQLATFTTVVTVSGPAV